MRIRVYIYRSKLILIYRIYTKWYYKSTYIPSNNTEYIQEIYIFIYTGIKKTHFCIIFYNFFMNTYKKSKKFFLFYIYIIYINIPAGCVVVIPYAGGAGDAGARRCRRWNDARPPGADGCTRGIVQIEIVYHG